MECVILMKYFSERDVYLNILQATRIRDIRQLGLSRGARGELLMWSENAPSKTGKWSGP